MTKYFLEIKNRIFLLFLTYFSTITVTYVYKETLLFLLVKPNSIFDNNDFTYLIFTDVTEIFSVYMQLIIFFSFQLITIFSVYHVFIFFSPAFFKNEYLYLKTLLKVLSFSWVVSMFLANYFLIPLTWNFFLSFQDLIIDTSFSIHFEAKLNEYIDFCISLYYLCGFYFQIFIIVFFILNHINISKNNIKKFRKLYYFSFIIFSTLISPPDILSQILISLFLTFVYESIILLFLFQKFLGKLN